MENSNGMRVLVLSDGTFRSAFITGLAVKEVGKESVKLFYAEEADSPRAQAIKKLGEYYEIPQTAFEYKDIEGAFNFTAKLFTALSYADNQGYAKVYYAASKQYGKAKRNYGLTYTHLNAIQVMVKCARHEHEEKGKRFRLPEPEAPAILLSPFQIVLLSHNYSIPMQLTWNCELNGKRPCGHCQSCIEWETVKRGKYD